MAQVFASAGAPRREVPAWLVRHEPCRVESAASDGGRLDAGEAEAIQLALDLHANLILIDESAGRKVARRLGLPNTGVLGVLAAAKYRGLVPAVAPLLAELRATGFWLGDELVARMLRDLGETS